ncbi:arabinosyltransferase C-terminal domain-containing protein [Nocardia nepalensis]|uniref:arabinosyltransferase C-terminal domain-containing protein n=1 Tax=Nocardia nepalensis TaxID=3375448 RepID=UPI003B66CA72
MTPLWQSHDGGGPLGWSNMLLRPVTLATYLDQDWRRCLERREPLPRSAPTHNRYGSAASQQTRPRPEPSSHAGARGGADQLAENHCPAAPRRTIGSLSSTTADQTSARALEPRRGDGRGGSARREPLPGSAPTHNRFAQQHHSRPDLGQSPRATPGRRAGRISSPRTTARQRPDAQSVSHSSAADRTPARALEPRRGVRVRRVSSPRTTARQRCDASSHAGAWGGAGQACREPLPGSAPTHNRVRSAARQTGPRP